MASIYQLVAYVGLVYVGFSWYTWSRKENIGHMYAMMSSMSMGMFIGLIGGLILGVQCKGDLYTSTIWSMFVGGICGFVFGIPITLLCVVEGALSGIMAGMMGAMLGEMVAIENIPGLLLVFVLMFTAFTLLLVKGIKTDPPETNHKKRRVIDIDNPIVPAIFLVSVFTWFQLLDMSFGYTEKGISIKAAYEKNQVVGEILQKTVNNPQNNFHKNPIHEINVKAIDFSYKPNQITVQKGVPFTLIIQNSGRVEHELEIASDALVITGSKNVHQHGSKKMPERVHLHVLPEGKLSGTITATKSGTFPFFCTISGHKESGMIGTLIVK